ILRNLGLRGLELIEQPSELSEHRFPAPLHRVEISQPLLGRSADFLEQSLQMRANLAEWARPEQRHEPAQKAQRTFLLPQQGLLPCLVPCPLVVQEAERTFLLPS